MQPELHKKEYDPTPAAEDEKNEGGRDMCDYMLIFFGSAFFLHLLIFLLRLYYLGNSTDSISVSSRNTTDTALKGSQNKGMTGSQQLTLLLATFTVGSVLYCSRYGVGSYVSRLDHCANTTFGFRVFSGREKSSPEDINNDKMDLEMGRMNKRNV